MNNTPKKKKKKIFSRRSPIGALLIVSLAVLILVLNILAFSYSWFTPTSETGKGLEFNAEYKLRSENCDFKTFEGEVVTAANRSQHQGYYIDQIAYSDTPIENYPEQKQILTVPAATTTIVDGETVKTPGRIYFRTEVQNNDENSPSVISLYHRKMPANLTVAVTYPTNTYYTSDEDYSDFFIIRNAYVKAKDQNDVDGPGLLPVEWFVENSTDADINIRVTPGTFNGETGRWLFLTYN